MRADGMGRVVARLYARRREALDQYTPFWPTGQHADGAEQDAGQDAASAKHLINKPGQDGQDGHHTKNTTGENTHAHANVSPRERPPEAGVSSHGPQFRPVRPVRPVPPSNGAGLSRTGRAASIPSVLSKPRPWDDDRGWIYEIIHAETPDARLAILFSWVLSAGGWISGMVAELPPLRPSLAKLELHRMLRAHGIGLREAADVELAFASHYPRVQQPRDSATLPRLLPSGSERSRRDHAPGGQS